MQAQVLSDAAADERLSGAKRLKDAAPVMFFKDCTVAWVSSLPRSARAPAGSACTRCPTRILLQRLLVLLGVRLVGPQIAVLLESGRS